MPPDYRKENTPISELNGDREIPMSDYKTSQGREVRQTGDKKAGNKLPISKAGRQRKKPSFSQSTPRRPPLRRRNQGTFQSLSDQALDQDNKSHAESKGKQADETPSKTSSKTELEPRTSSINFRTEFEDVNATQPIETTTRLVSEWTAKARDDSNMSGSEEISSVVSNSVANVTDLKEKEYRKEDLDVSTFR
jgi:hypothetical protein